MNKQLLSIAALSLCMSLASCSDDELPYSEAQVTNTELRTILEKQGIQFDETGHMLLDDKVQNLTKLDLTGTKFTDFNSLTILPNLNELDLSDNEFGPTFDFSVLPTQITGVDLTGNDIYDFEGLVDAKVENDELKTTIKHKLVKLHLSESAKWNVEDLMPFYTQSKADGTTVDMQMEDKGALKPYTTLREIPNETIRGILKNTFSSVFEGELLNIAKPMDAKDEGQNLIIEESTDSYEGIEYFINNPYYKKFGVFVFGADTSCELGYMMPGGNMNTMNMPNLQFTGGLNLSKATALGSVLFENNKALTSLDFTNTAMGKITVKQFEGLSRVDVQLINCENLEEVKFDKKLIGHAADFKFIKLPKLKSLDLSEFKCFQTLHLIYLPKCEFTMPTSLMHTDVAHKELLDRPTEFVLTKDVYAKASVKTFVDTLKGKDIENNPFECYNYDNPDDFVEY